MKLSSLFRRSSGSARNARRSGLHSVEALESRIAPAAIITATLTDNTAVGVATGGTIHYTEVVSNTAVVAAGNDALLLQITHGFDANTTLVPGSLNISPLAFDDVFSAVGNTQLIVGGATPSTPAVVVGGNILANDVEFMNDLGVLDTFTLSTTGTIATTGGGSVTLAANGTFTYTPAAGFVGADTFTYTIRDDGIDNIAANADDLTGTGTVTINVASKVWYVDNSGANGDGRSNTPFNSLASVSGATGPDAAGDIIFVRTGSGNYTSAMTLLANQTLWGENTALVVNSLTLKTAGVAPVLAPVAGTAVTLASGNTLQGFTIGDSQRDILGTNFGTLTVSNVTLSGTGKTLDLTTGTFAAGSAFNSVASTGTSGLTTNGHGMSIVSVAGSVSFGSTTISGVEAQSVFVTNSTVNIDFGNTTIGTAAANSGGNEGLRLEANPSGTFTFGTLTIQNVSGRGFSLFGNGAPAATAANATITGLATISKTSSDAVLVQNTAGNVSFQSLSLDTITGRGLAFFNDTGNFTTTGGTITTVSGTDVDLTGATNSGVVTIAESITNTVGGFINIDNHETNNVTFSGLLSSNTATGGITVANSNSGTIAFTNASKTLSTSTGTAVTLSSNAGGTINFTGGGLAITTTTAAGFNATGGGTVSVQGTGNTIASTTGTALNVANTTIGASGLTFLKIASNGATSGIILNNTGAGGLTVTGDAGAANNGSGGVIQSSTGVGISLTTTGPISLGYMNVANSGTDGIKGSGINGFTLNRSNITDAPTGGATDDGVDLANVSGAVTFTNNLIDKAPHNDVLVDNFNTNMASFTMTGNTISNDATSNPPQNDGLLLVIRGTSVLPFGNIQSNTFSGMRAVAVQIQTNDSGRIGVNNGAVSVTALTAANSIIVQNNTFTSNGQGIDIGTSQISNLTFQVLNNTIVGKVTVPNAIANTASSTAINAFTAAGADTGPTVHSFVGKIDGNIIGTQGVKDSGSGFGNGVRAVVQGQSTQGVITISNNMIREVPNAAIINIFGQNGAAANSTASAFAKFKITGNTMPAISGSNLSLGGPANTPIADAGIFVLADEGFPVSTVITGNTIYDVTTASGSFDVYLAERVGPPAGAQLTVEGTGSVSSYILANNTLAGANKFIDEGAGSGTPSSLVAIGTNTYPLFFSPTADDVVTPPTQPPVVIVPPPVIVDDGGTTVQPPVVTPPVIQPPVVQPPVIVDDGLLSQAELDSLVGAAIARWEAAGITPEQIALLHQVSFSVVDLPGLYLGEASAGHVTLDSNAAGNAWFIDPTPYDDSEYVGTGTRLSATSSNGAASRVDALSTVMHELGHQLGLEDSYANVDSANLMYGYIHLGERRLPAAHQADGATPHLEGAQIDFAFSPIAIGTLPAQKNVTVVFDAKVPSNATVTSVSVQGTITASGGINVLTDDPDVAGATNPTVTSIDLPDVTVTVAPGSVNEDGAGTLVYTFSRTGVNDFTRVVNFAASGTALFGGAGADYTVTSGGTFTFDTSTGLGTVTFPANSATVTVTLNPTDDTTVEPDETAVLTVTAGTGYDVVAPSVASGTILNDDTSIAVTVSPSSVTEDGAANLVYTFTRSGLTTGTHTANFSITGPATLTSADYSVLAAAGITFNAGSGTGTVAFAANELTKIVTVDPTADSTVEADENVVVTITSGTGYTIGGTPATGTILNDDSTVSVAVSPASVAEDGATNLSYTFTRTGVLSSALTVDFTVGGTAVFVAGAGTDYTAIGATTFTPTTGSVTFGAGSNTAILTIDPTADATAEPDETVVLTLAASGSGYTSISPVAATGTILNDDTLVTVSIGASSVLESSAAGLVYTFTRTGDTSAALAINFSATGGATFTSDYTASSTGTLNFGAGTLTIPIGSASATVTLVSVDDRLVEGDETAVLTVLAGSGYGPSGSPATGTITDNDTATLGFTLGVSSGLESVGTQNVGTTLTINAIGTGTIGLASALTVNVTSTGGTATGGGTDYTLPVSPAVTFAAGTYATGTATQNAGITIIDDRQVEGNETALLGLSIAQNIGTQVSIGGTTAHTVTITDNDTATLGFTVGTSSGLESVGTQNVGTTLTINAIGTGTIGLASALTANVTSTGGTATGGGTDYTLPVSPAVTFAAGTYATGTATQNAGLTIIDDRQVEGDETALLGLSIAQNIGTQVSIGGTTAHTLTITDNDTATLAFTAGTSSGLESVGTQNVGTTLTINAIGTGTIGLASALTANVTSTGGTATGGGTDYTLPVSPAVTFAAGTYATGTATQNAGLTIIDDRLVEGNETALLGLSIAQNIGTQVSIGGTTAHTLTITDNDTATLSIVPTLNATEAGGTQNVTVTLTTSDGAGGTATLAMALTADVTDAGGGTATSGSDYTAFGTKTVTFGIGSGNNVTQTVGLTVLNDSLLENDETVRLSLGNLNTTLSGQASLGTTSSTATILDNETATLSIVPTLNVTEQGGTQNVTVTLNIVGDAGGTAQIGAGISITGDIVDATGGTATAGNDYTAFGTKTVTFGAGSNSGATQTVGLTVINDTLVEGNETVNLKLQNPVSPLGGRVTLGNVNGVATITDNDTATLSIVPTQNATEAGGTQNVTVILTTSDGAGGTATLATALTADVTDAGGGTATSGSDYTAFGTQTVTFGIGSGNNATQTVGLTVLNDSLLENDETVRLSLGNLNTTLNGQASLGTTSSTATILDNETATLSFDSTASVTEQGGTQNVTLTLNIVGDTGGTAQIGDGASVTADVVDAGGGSATSGNDYTAFGTKTVTFGAGSTSGATQTAGLAVLDDQSSEGNETVNLQLQNLSPTGRVTATGGGTLAVTILDNDVDLRVSKTESTPTVIAGSGAGNLVYIVKVENVGMTNATGVTLSEVLGLPAGVTVTSVVGSGTTAFSGTTWTVGELAVNGSETLTVTLTADSSTAKGTDVISDTATISGADQNLVNTGDDSATERTSVDRQVDLVISKDDDNGTVHGGDTLTYTLSYNNAGPSDATGVVLTETVPTGTTFNAGASTAGWTETSPGSGTYTLAVGTVAGAGNGAASFVVRVNNLAAAGLDTISNAVSIADDGTAGADLNPANNMATDDDILDAAPDLVVTKTTNVSQAVRGGSLTYTLTYSNTGDQDATKVSIVETLPLHTSFNAAANIGWTETSPGSGSYRFDIGDLAAGATAQSVTFVVNVADTISATIRNITNSANISDDQTNGSDRRTSDNDFTLDTQIYQGIYVVAPGHRADEPLSAASTRLSPRGGSIDPSVRVFDVASGNELFQLDPYTGQAGVRVTVGDFNGDGIDDIVTAKRTGNGNIRVFDGRDGSPLLINRLTTLDPGTIRSSNGVFLASADVTGDGRDDIIIGEGLGGKKVKVIDGVTGALVNTFEPFGGGYAKGIRIAAGDVNGDGRADIVVSQNGSGSTVKVYDGRNLTGITPSTPTLFTLSGGGAGGVSVTVGDVDGDGSADVITGSNPSKAGNAGKVKIFSGATGLKIREIAPLGGEFFRGIRVAAVDLDLDGLADIIAASGPGAKSKIEYYSGADGSLIDGTKVFPTAPTLGVFVAGTTPILSVFRPSNPE